MSLKQWFRFWFDFTPSERRGIIFLFTLLILFLGLKFYLSHIQETKQHEQIDFSRFENEIDSFLTQNTIKQTPRKAFLSDTIQNDSTSFTDTIISKPHYKYKKHHSSKRYKRKTPFTQIIDINTADTASLKSLYGIGEKLSVRIVKYRKQLGGFYAIDQLKEVYGLRPETFDNIKSHLSCDTTFVKKLNVNTATFKTLLHHPYLNYRQVKAIFRYKDKHHSIKKLLELKPLLGKSYKKLYPYLSLDN